MKEQLITYYSNVLQREMKALQFGDSGIPVLIFPTTLGSYYEAKDFLLIESGRWFVETGKVTIFTIDSINNESWYDKKIHPLDRAQRYNAYDKFVHEEFVPHLIKHSPTGKIIVGGPSFGGYMAANYAFKHPENVSHLLSMSGSFDIKSFVDGHYNDEVYFNNPIDFVPNNENENFHNINIVLGTSNADICKDSNYDMSAILTAKGIDHWLDIRGDQAHDWPLWRDMFPDYLGKI